MTDIKKARTELGLLIKNAREDKNLSQDGLATLLEMERQQIYRIETAKSGTSQETALKVAKILDLDSEKLLLLVAGIPSKEERRKITNPMEFFEALEELGLEVNFEGGIKSLKNLDENDLQELLDSVMSNASAKVKRKYKEMMK